MRAWIAKNPERNKRNRERWLKENARKVRSDKLMKKFGISLEQYEEMFADQGGCCKICNQPETVVNRQLAVDHCHATGKIRGLLCSKCNKAIGLFQDDCERLLRAVGYLRQ